MYLKFIQLSNCLDISYKGLHFYGQFNNWSICNSIIRLNGFTIITVVKKFNYLVNSYLFTLALAKKLILFRNSLDWLIPEFLYAIFVQRSILAMNLSIFTLSLPSLSFWARRPFFYIPKEMLLLILFVHFLTNYDITTRKQ